MTYAVRGTYLWAVGVRNSYPLLICQLWIPTEIQDRCMKLGSTWSEQHERRPSQQCTARRCFGNCCSLPCSYTRWWCLHPACPGARFSLSDRDTGVRAGASAAQASRSLWPLVGYHHFPELYRWQDSSLAELFNGGFNVQFFHDWKVEDGVSDNRVQSSAPPICPSACWGMWWFPLSLSSKGSL